MSISPADYFYQDFLNENANISAKNRNEMCDLAYSFKKQKLLIFSLFICASLSLVTLIILYFVFKNKEVRRIYFLTQLDLKFILVVTFATYAITSLNSLLFFVYQLLILLIDFPACSYIVNGFFCFYSQRLFVSLCPMISFFVFFAMFLERCYTSIGFRPYGIFGFFLAFTIVALTVALQFVLIDPKSYEHERIFCASIVTRTDTNFKAASYASIIFEFAIGAGDFLLLLYNKRRISDYKKRNGFNLNKSFNLKSIELSIKFIYPISFVNALGFCFQTMIFLIYKSNALSYTLENGVLMLEMTNLARLMANFIVIGTVWCLGLFHRKKPKQTAVMMNEADIFFQQFNAMIA